MLLIGVVLIKYVMTESMECWTHPVIALGK